jgi:hypothetical protein
LVVVGVGWHSGQPVHQRVDALSFGGMAVAQCCPRSSGEPVGGLGSAAFTEREQGVGEYRCECCERLIIVGGTSFHGLIVFTALL